MISQITTFQSDIQSVHVVQPSTEHDKVSLWPGIISWQVFSYTNDKVNHHNVSQSFNGQVQDISFFQWSIISILCPCWHLQIIIFFLRKIKKPKMTSFVKLAAITYLWLVWNKNGLVIVFIRKLIFCYMMIHLTVRINCTFLYSFMLRYICLCNWTPFLPNQPVAARVDEERDDSLIHHDNPRMWWSSQNDYIPQQQLPAWH